MKAEVGIATTDVDDDDTAACRLTSSYMYNLVTYDCLAIEFVC